MTVCSEYLGRVDNQVKVRGYRIELGEIEATLASEPRVKSCAVLVRGRHPGNKQLVGYVVTRGDSMPTAEDLREFVKQKLPEYMAPAQFVFLDSIPLTQNGKVDRKALPAPSLRNLFSSAARNPPRRATETEKALAEIWTKPLKVEQIGIHDDFFDFGGHSLMAMRAVSQIEERFGSKSLSRGVFGSANHCRGWHHNATPDEAAYSPMDLISPRNIARLGLAWSWDLPGERSLQATPLAVNRVLYFTGSYSAVYAVDDGTRKTSVELRSRNLETRSQKCALRCRSIAAWRIATDAIFLQARWTDVCWHWMPGPGGYCGALRRRRRRSHADDQRCAARIQRQSDHRQRRRGLRRARLCDRL